MNSYYYYWWQYYTHILYLLIQVQQLSQCVCVYCAQSLSHVQPFATPWTIASQAPLSMGILQAIILEWAASGDFPNPGIEPRSPALQADSLPSELPGKPQGSQTNITSGFYLQCSGIYSVDLSAANMQLYPTVLNYKAKHIAITHKNNEIKRSSLERKSIAI